MLHGAASSTAELQDELSSNERKLHERQAVLDARMRSLQDENDRALELEKAIDAAEAQRARWHVEFKTASRARQVTENEQQLQYDQAAGTTREEYVTMLKDKDAACEGVEEEINELAEKIRGRRAGGNGEAHKRLAVARLVSMLDDLRNALGAKVQEAEGDEDAHAQECFRTLQELSRERERTLVLLEKKERAIEAAIALKKKRIEELRAEAEQNLGVLREDNERELLTITERIQRERQRLLGEIERMRTANERLMEVLRETKLSAEGAVTDRSATLPLDLAVTASPDPEQESALLRDRIAEAGAEHQRLAQRIDQLKEHMEDDTNRYSEKMSHIQTKILIYQDEFARLEQENKDIKAACDHMATLLQQ